MEESKDKLQFTRKNKLFNGEKKLKLKKKDKGDIEPGDKLEKWKILI